MLSQGRIKFETFKITDFILLLKSSRELRLGKGQSQRRNCYISSAFADARCSHNVSNAEAKGAGPKADTTADDEPFMRWS